VRGHSDIPKTAGIYGIYSAINDSIYVGSSICMWRRTKQHKTDLKCGRHPNDHLQNAYNKHGVDEFVMIVLENSDIEEKDYLLDREQYWIDYCRDNFNAVYNDKPLAASTKGRPHTQEAKEKIRRNSVVFMNLPESREKYSNLMKERMQDPVFRQKAKDAATKTWNVTLYDPEGNPHYIERNLKQFCIDNELLYSNMQLVIKGKQAHHKGWRVNPTFDYLTNHGSANVYRGTLVSPTGEEYRNIKNAKQFAEQHGFDYGGFLRMLKGKLKSYKGWKYYKESELEEK
jgi:group I intron endonuclease